MIVWKDFLEWYYKTLSRWFKFDKQSKLLEIDFGKPWYQVIYKQKWIYIFELISEILQSVYLTLTPLVIEYIYNSRSYQTILFFVSGYILLEIFNRIILKRFYLATNKAGESINFAAYKPLLLVDPIWHTTRSTGQIISKIESASKEVHYSVIPTFFGNIIPLLAGFVTLVITFLNFEFRLAAIALFWVILITGINALLSFINSLSFSRVSFKSRDRRTEINVENIQQNNFIRSTFATQDQIRKSRKATRDYLTIETEDWYARGIATSVTRLLYIVSCLMVFWVALDLVSAGQITIRGQLLWP